MSEQKKEDQMKLRKAAYKEANKKQMCVYNLTNTVVSIALGAATFFILNGNPEALCDGINIRICLWLIMGMHVINAIEAVLDFTYLDEIICCCCCVLGFAAYEVGVLIYMNVIFFSASMCEKQTPLLYFWLMTNMILFYFSTAIWIFFKLKAWFGSPSEEEKQ
jgi:hypothetical protein